MLNRTLRPISVALALLPLTDVLSGLPPTVAARPDEGEGPRAADVKLLEDAGVKTDGPGLVAFLRKQPASEEQRRNISSLIRQLGDEDFEVREKATRALIDLGIPAVPALQRALSSTDLEVVRRVKTCLAAIKGGPPEELWSAAARVLATRKREPQSVAVLLALVPDTAGTPTEDTLVEALLALGGRDGKVDPALSAALTDKLPVRRAVAAEVLVGVDVARQREAIRKLLTDPNRAVRLHVALVLAYARDKEAVPVLIDLLAELPGKQAGEAEDFLRRLAGDKAPPAPRGDEARKKYRDDWQAWWKANRATSDLTGLDPGPPRKVKVRAQASGAFAKETTPDKPFDLDRPAIWNSGNNPPQWIEADLGAIHHLERIRLLAHQSPNGETTHEVWVSSEPIGRDRSKAKLAHTFKGQTKNDHFIMFAFPRGSTARHVQVLTTQSPSWVAWGSIELRVGRTRSRFVIDEGK